jgi:hypothetical protein
VGYAMFRPRRRSSQLRQLPHHLIRECHRL